MRFFVTLIVILAVSCVPTGTHTRGDLSSGIGDRNTGLVSTVPITASGFGEYPVAVTEVRFDNIEKMVGVDSPLSPVEREHFWNGIVGKMVTWTGQIVQIGDVHPSHHTVHLKVGKSASRWDVLAFFIPDYSTRLKRVGEEGYLTFSGVLRSYKVTEDGVQVTISSGRMQ